MTDSLSKIEQIHFKKDVSGLILYKDFINNILIINNNEISDNKNKVYMTELIRLKNYLEKEIKHTTKRIEMLK